MSQYVDNRNASNDEVMAKLDVEAALCQLAWDAEYIWIARCGEVTYVDFEPTEPGDVSIASSLGIVLVRDRAAHNLRWTLIWTKLNEQD